MNLRLWGWPLVLGAVSAVGLIAGLVSDGTGDVLAWLGLGLPILVALRYGLSRR